MSIVESTIYPEFSETPQNDKFIISDGFKGTFGHFKRDHCFSDTLQHHLNKMHDVIKTQIFISYPY